jgi:YjjG family noncanonical pyrimidine nucleotidase
MKYNWLLFDADGTLFDYEKAEFSALAATFRQFGQPFAPSYADVYKKINQRLWLAFERGGVSAERLRTRRFALLGEEIGIRLPIREFSDAYLANLAMCADLIDGAEETLSALHGRVGLLIITNGLRDVQRPRLARSPIARYFADVVISDEVGFAKPDHRIFDAAFRRMGWPEKEHVLIVGDSLTSDIKGGSDYGIDTCWFNPQRLPASPEVTIRHEIHDLAELMRVIE